MTLTLVKNPNKSDTQGVIGIEDLPISSINYQKIGDSVKEPEVRLHNVPLSREIQEFTQEMCVEYGVPIDLAYAVMRLESNFRVDAIGKTNDYGIMQINICNHKWLMDKFGFDDIMDYRNNIRSGVYMLGLHLGQSGGDIVWALMMYNDGVNGAQIKRNNGEFSTNYTKIVMRYYDEGFELDGQIF